MDAPQKSETPRRRSSLVSNIDAWLDKCSNEEPDSLIYDPDYTVEVSTIRSKQLEPEITNLYKNAAEICTKIGLSPQVIEERLNDIDECILTCFSDIQKHIEDEYERLCQFKQELFNQIQKMTSDLFLPPYDLNNNVTLLQNCITLKARHQELNSIREKRVKKLEELRNKQAKHSLALGIKPPIVKFKTDIPSEEELAELAGAVAELEREEKRRKDKYNLLRDLIVQIMDSLEHRPENEFERSIVNPSLPNYSMDHLKRMDNFHIKLEEQYKVNKRKFETLYEKLTSLYNRLEVDQGERDLFLGSHNVCKPSMMAEMELEIERYELLKRQNMEKFIVTTKEELMKEYERCFVKPEQQETFFNLSTVSGECNEEILELYEGELARIKKYYQDNKIILEKFHMWRGMIQELKEMAAKANDPNRFNNRGGQLLIEERKRNKLQKGIPRLEQEILTLAAQSKEKVKIYGQDIDKYIAGSCNNTQGSARKQTDQKRSRMYVGSVNSSQKKANLTRQLNTTRTPLKSGNNHTTTTTITTRHGSGGPQSFTGSSPSISERMFEDMIVCCPASAKKPRRDQH